jgi:aconitate decarboxylase
MGLTAALGAFVVQARPFAPSARRMALRGIVDAFGCLLAARHEPVVGTLRRRLEPAGALQPGGESCPFLSARRVRPEDAAMVNATAAHALALDDVAFGCHPSSLLMPALFALAEEVHPTGAELLDAYVAGFEVLAELSTREPEGWHRSGWHPSALLGPVAVAGAAARLLRLDAPRAARALALASSLSGGVAANFGTQTKALHAGRAAAAGVLAAALVGEGVTAAEDALERANGLLAVASPAGRVRLDEHLGMSAPQLRLLDPGLSFKQYPVCYSLHRVVDACIDIARQPGFDAERLEWVDVHLGRAQAEMARHHRPLTPLEAKYSVEFAAVSGLLAGAAGHAQLEPGFIASARVQQALGCVRLHLRDDCSGDDGVFSASDRVFVQDTARRVFDSGEVAHARGHARRPLEDAALRAKFLDGASRGGFPDASACFEALQTIGHASDAATVVAALGPSLGAMR